MKKRLKIIKLLAGFVALSNVQLILAVAQMPDGPVPVVAKVVEPVKPTPAAPKIVVTKPVVAVPVAPKVVPVKPIAVKKSVPVVPKIVPVQPVVPKPMPIAAKSVAPKIVTPIKPVTAVVKPFVQPEKLASQIVGVISVKNNSKYSTSWTGWKTKYKTLDGKIHYKLHHLKVPHQLQPSGKHKMAKTLQEYTVHNLPEQSFVEGVSHLMINDQPIDVEYQGSAWMPGVTDAIYITSANGTSWMLDKKAMDKNYKKINAGIQKSKRTVADDDSISKVTNDTKAATVAVVLKNKKNQKKFKNISRKSVSSKASKAFEHVSDAKSV
ncbi:hypothetical protein KBB68_02780 [Candidatus Babeliales bacterium]|nr:hypothetical protein [Candidatus Babeliales bacterium]